MTYVDIIQLISNLGFPIVMCAALFYRMVKSDEIHREEMDKFNTSLNNNTMAITRLLERLEKED